MPFMIDDRFNPPTVIEDAQGRFGTVAEAYGYLVDNDMGFAYEATHASTNDGSTAMVTAVSEAGYSLMLINEDGHQWCDPIGWWIPLDEVTDAHREAWAENEADDYDYTGYDYPEYDAQTAFYEQTGRMQFPNEY